MLVVPGSRAGRKGHVTWSRFRVRHFGFHENSFGRRSLRSSILSVRFTGYSVTLVAAVGSVNYYPTWLRGKNMKR